MSRGRVERQGAVAGAAAPQRQSRGRRNWHSGLAAEDAAARHYRGRGATVLARRLRTPDGELDLVVRQGEMLVFVEVKRRVAANPDSPVTERQWQRLEKAALHYMMSVQKETGVQPVCRFDVALAGSDGQIRIIENARSFE